MRQTLVTVDDGSIEIEIRISVNPDPDADADPDFDPDTIVHAERAATPPPIHQDPFERMLIAQGFEESLTIATIDARFTHYGSELLGQ